MDEQLSFCPALGIYDLHFKLAPELMPALGECIAQCGIIADNGAKQISSSALVVTVKDMSALTRKKLKQTVILGAGEEEVLTESGNYQTYVHKDGVALVFSFQARAWEMAVDLEGWQQGRLSATGLKKAMGRVISWALLPRSVVGLWGVHVDDGMVLMSANKSFGESVFFDLKNEKVLSQDGIFEMTPAPQLLSLNPTLSSESRSVLPEEMFTRMVAKSTYLGWGVCASLLQSFYFDLSLQVTGVEYPERLYRPREQSSKSA